MTRNQRYYAENREREQARARAWRQANPEVMESTDPIYPLVAQKLVRLGLQ